jgi:hypothetical protein
MRLSTGKLGSTSATTMSPTALAQFQWCNSGDGKAELLSSRDKG